MKEFHGCSKKTLHGRAYGYNNHMIKEEMIALICDGASQKRAFVQSS